jgi:DNA-binding response OmpR family regulator
MAKVLVIEDDVELADSIQDWLTDEKHTVDVVHTGSEGLERLRYCSYDLAILDWKLPALAGIEVCKTYRSEGGSTLILMLTGRDTIEDKETGLDAGADDYLPKPFDPRELTARLRALLRRPKTHPKSVYAFGDLTLDPRALTLTKAGAEIKLQPREFALLEFFMRYPDEVFSSEAIMERVWSTESETAPDTVRVHIRKIRSKIDTPGEPSFIRNVPRLGYSFNPPD